MDAQAILVQRAAGGLPTSVQAAAVRNAVNLDAGRPVGGPISGLAGALADPEHQRDLSRLPRAVDDCPDVPVLPPVGVGGTASGRKPDLCQPVRL